MIPATEKGLKTFPWWPDWRNECVAIVASGPSVKAMDLGSLRDRIHVIAIKRNHEKCPWAEVVYGCDAAWWVSNQGLPKFGGLKLFHGAQAEQFKGLHRVSIKMSDEILVDEPLLIGNGGNSGFQALNLAVQFGATSIILIGYDLHDRGGVHWYGRNTAQGMNNPAKVNFTRWHNGFNAVKQTLKNLNIDVVNVSPDSNLDSFPRRALNVVMEEWGL